MVQVCYEVANQAQRVLECHTVEQDFFLPRTFVVLGTIVLCTLLMLLAQHRYFRKFDQ